MLGVIQYDQNTTTDNTQATTKTNTTFSSTNVEILKPIPDKPNPPPLLFTCNGNFKRTNYMFFDDFFCYKKNFVGMPMTDDDRLGLFKLHLLLANEHEKKQIYNYLYCSVNNIESPKDESIFFETTCSLDIMKSMNDVLFKEKMIDLVAESLNTGNSHAK